MILFLIIPGLVLFGSILYLTIDWKSYFGTGSNILQILLFTHHSDWFIRTNPEIGQIYQHYFSFKKTREKPKLQRIRTVSDVSVSKLKLIIMQRKKYSSYFILNQLFEINRAFVSKLILMMIIFSFVLALIKKRITLNIM